MLAVDANPSSLVTTLGVETPSTGFNLRVKVALVRVTETLTPLKIRKKCACCLFPYFEACLVSSVKWWSPTKIKSFDIDFSV